MRRSRRRRHGNTKTTKLRLNLERLEGRNVVGAITGWSSTLSNNINTATMMNRE
jgi:hypothetical protein